MSVEDKKDIVLDVHKEAVLNVRCGPPCGVPILQPGWRVTAEWGEMVGNSK